MVAVALLILNNFHQPQIKRNYMKTKSLILIAFAAIITLSFSFAASNRSEKISAQKTTVAQENQYNNEPVGGFISEDKL